MTKKVLISWLDYIKLQEQAMQYKVPYEESSLRLMKFRELFIEWFDAQPDVNLPLAKQMKTAGKNDEN